MKTSPLNGLPIYEDADLLRYGTQQQATITALDSRVIGRYTTRAAAEAAAGAFTGQGGVLTDGMVRTVGGYLETWRSGAWRGVMPSTVQTTVFFETTFSNTAEAGVASLAIPDPGVSYFLDCSGAVSISANAGVTVEAHLRIDAAGGTVASPTRYRSGQLPPGELISLEFPAYRVGPYTGAHTLLCTVRRPAAGTGNWAVLAGGNYLRANIVPV